MRALAYLILTIVSLLHSATQLEAKEYKRESLQPMVPVWYQPKPMRSSTEAAATIIDLTRFFGTWAEHPLDSIEVNRDGLRVSTSTTIVESNAQWVPSYGGAWVGGRYVPYYAGSTVTTQTPVTHQMQSWIGFSDVVGIFIARHPPDQGRMQWSVNIVSKGHLIPSTLRTYDPGLARQLADAIVTLLYEANPRALGYAKLGLTTADPDSRDLKRVKLKGSAGALVLQVWTDGPGDAAGVKTDDLIIQANGQPVRSASDLDRISSDALGQRPDAVVSLKILRAGNPIDLDVKAHNSLLTYETAYKTRDLGAPRPFGVSVRELASDDPGRKRGASLVITAVVPASSAANLDVREGDLLLEVNGKQITSIATLTAVIGEGQIVSVKVIRKDAVILLQPSISL